jgi:hypothetical protein
MLLLGIFLADRLLAAPVPHQLGHLVRADTHVRDLADYVSARLFLCTEDKKLTEEYQLISQLEEIGSGASDSQAQGQTQALRLAKIPPISADTISLLVATSHLGVPLPTSLSDKLQQDIKGKFSSAT